MNPVQNPTVVALNSENQREEYIVKHDEILSDVDKHLAEISQTFQAVGQNSINTIINAAEYVKADMDKKSKQVLVKLQDDFNAYVNNNIEMLTQRIATSGITIAMPELNVQASIQIGDHEQMAKALVLVGIHKQLLIYGPAGSGKTYMASSMASRMGLQSAKYSCNGQSTLGSLKGFYQPSTGGYVETPLLKLFTEGGVFILDEYDSMPPELAIFINGIADGSKTIELHGHPDGIKVYHRHENFILILCGNTNGSGDYKFSAREIQDSALMDRFKSCRLLIDYDPTVEKSYVNTLSGTKYNYTLFKELRTTIEKLGLTFGTRNLIDLVANLRVALSNTVPFTPKDAITPLLLDIQDETTKKNILAKWA